MIPETAKKAMAVWMASDTWHTGHPSDMGRYYDFVTALCDERFMDEGLIRQTIHKEIETHHPKFNWEEKEELVDQFVQLTARIYGYKVLRDFKEIWGMGASCWWCP